MSRTQLRRWAEAKPVHTTPVELSTGSSTNLCRLYAGTPLSAVKPPPPAFNPPTAPSLPLAEPETPLGYFVGLGRVASGETSMLRDVLAPPSFQERKRKRRRRKWKGKKGNGATAV